MKSANNGGRRLGRVNLPPQGKIWIATRKAWRPFDIWVQFLPSADPQRESCATIWGGIPFSGQLGDVMTLRWFPTPNSAEGKNVFYPWWWRSAASLIRASETFIPSTSSRSNMSSPPTKVLAVKVEIGLTPRSACRLSITRVPDAIDCSS